MRALVTSEGVAGYTYWADVYCPPCGEEKPDVDPEGSEKRAIFPWDESGAREYCGDCGDELQTSRYGCDFVGDEHPFDDCEGGDVCQWHLEEE